MSNVTFVAEWMNTVNTVNLKYFSLRRNLVSCLKYLSNTF